MSDSQASRMENFPCAFCDYVNVIEVAGEGLHVFKFTCRKCNRINQAKLSMEFLPDKNTHSEHFRCTFCHHEILTFDYRLREQVYQFKCWKCGRIGYIHKDAHMQKALDDFYERHNVPKPVINKEKLVTDSIPGDMEDDDNPPKEGVRDIWPLAMEVAAKQLLKGLESYGTLLQAGNGRFMDLPPEAFDFFIYSVQQREDFRFLIGLLRRIDKASAKLIVLMDEVLANEGALLRSDEIETQINILKECVREWRSYDKYPEDLTIK